MRPIIRRMEAIRGEPLKAALQDESRDVQDAARWALSQIDDEDRSLRVRVRPKVKKRI